MGDFQLMTDYEYGRVLDLFDDVAGALERLVKAVKELEKRVQYLEANQMKLCIEEYWRCSCGQLNSNYRKVCHECGSIPSR